MNIYKYIISAFPKVPFLRLFDYWNKLATRRKILTTASLDAIRLRFHSLAFPDSACFAALPPDSAVLENVTVEVAQGATIEYMPVLSFLYHENDLPYHSLEAVIDIMRTKGLLISLPESSQSSLVQPNDSYFDLLPLSAYADLDRVGG